MKAPRHRLAVLLLLAPLACAASADPPNLAPRGLGLLDDPLYDRGVDYEPLAAFDLSGVQKRRIGSRVDIGCYEANASGTLILFK